MATACGDRPPSAINELTVSIFSISYLSGGLPLVVGFLKYRQIVQFNSLTVKRFQNTYQGQMDVKKYNDYVNKTF